MILGGPETGLGWVSEPLVLRTLTLLGDSSLPLLYQIDPFGTRRQKGGMCASDPEALIRGFFFSSVRDPMIKGGPGTG
jgi:hypothetical protein